MNGPMEMVYDLVAGTGKTGRADDRRNHMCNGNDWKFHQCPDTQNEVFNKLLGPLPAAVLPGIMLPVVAPPPGAPQPNSRVKNQWIIPGLGYNSPSGLTYTCDE